MSGNKEALFRLSEKKASINRNVRIEAFFIVFMKNRVCDVESSEEGNTDTIVPLKKALSGFFHTARIEAVSQLHTKLFFGNRI